MPKSPRPAPGPLGQAIAATIRGQMGVLNISKAELARRTGIDRTILGLMVRGLQRIDVEYLDIICSALSLSLSQVVHDAEKATWERKTERGPATPGFQEPVKLKRV